MHNVSGLPLDGDPYEEYVPPSHEVDPSLLLYPNFLCRLFDIWNKLSEGGHVGFQEWCDFFHNRLDDTFFIKNLQDGRLYTAAFIALWIRRFVIPGGGPYIRPGVLVMAAWITIGRRISLAPPALCSLYYSLRMISTHPIGPSFTKRPWPVHYVIGWIGTYLRTPFGNKYKTNPIPFYKHLASKPEMLNTMSRTPTPFDSVEAHNYLQKFTNIKWHPYILNTLQGDEYLQRIFRISIRRGMLPWRRDNLCIAEPYHPDRVARQFRLDQLIPYPPLTSLYTRDEVGVAHAFWAHLLRADQGELNYFPESTRTGDSSVMWVNWLVKFMKPVTGILDELKHGNLTGKIPYDQRKQSKHALQRHIQSRKLCSKDLHVIKRVGVERREQHIAAIEIEEARVRDRWQPILHNYLNDAAADALPVQANEQGTLLPDEVGAGTSSAHPVAIDNEPLEIVPTSGEKRCRQSSPIPVGEKARLLSKRKLDFSAEPASSEQFDSALLDLDIDGLISDDDLNCEFTVEEERAYRDIFGTCLEGDQMDGLGMSHTSMGVENMPPTPNALNPSSILHGVGDLLVPDKDMSSQNVAPPMDISSSFMEVFVKATESVLKTALEGLDVSTIVDPQRQQALRELILMLPSIPQVVCIRETLGRIVSISIEMQEANGGIDAASAKRTEAIAKADSKAASLEGALKDASDEVVSETELQVERKKLMESLAARLKEATSAFHAGEAKLARLNSLQSAKQSEAKELRDALHETNSKAAQEIEVVKQKTTALSIEAGSLFETLKNWRPM
ncbi:unnamed protein product [Alopecurus aequalis]